MGNVCLTEGRSFEFKFIDSYNDGICCSAGKGYYRVLDSCGDVVVNSGGKNNEAFDKKTHTLQVKDDNSCVTAPNPTNPPTKLCTNKKRKRFSINGTKKRRRSCRSHAKRGNCNSRTSTGDFVWQLCSKSCNKCN